MLDGVLDHPAIIHVRDDDESDEAEQLLEEADRLFSSQKIHLHSNYADYFAVQHEDHVIAAAAVSVGDDDDAPYVEFSVATAPEHHRRGLARMLVLRVIRHAKEMQSEYWEGADVRVEAYVVNPTAMEPLLRSLDFVQSSEDAHDWSKILTA